MAIELTLNLVAEASCIAYTRCIELAGIAFTLLALDSSSCCVDITQAQPLSPPVPRRDTTLNNGPVSANSMLQNYANGGIAGGQIMHRELRVPVRRDRLRRL